MHTHDQTIQKVKDALKNDAKSIKGADIFVSVEDDSVVLKGVVDSRTEADKAVEIARKAVGDKAVRQEFRILSEQKQPDATGSTGSVGYSNTSDDQGCSPSPRVG